MFLVRRGQLTKAAASFAACISLAVALGCSSSSVETGVVEQTLLEGHPSGPEDDGVVLVQTASTRCSGALVAPNLLLTSRHCVASQSALTFSCGLDGELAVGPGGTLGADVHPSMVEVFAGSPHGDTPVAFGREIHSTGTPVICRDDLAFVVLDRDLTNPTYPLRMLEPTRSDEAVIAVGYGQSEAAPPEHRSRLDGITVLAVGPDELAAGEVGEAPPRSFALGRSVCYGDSGGPAISAESGAVMGVYSLLTGACDSDSVRNYYVQVRPFPDLVERAFAAAGKPLWVEGGAAPGSNAPCDRCDESGCVVARSACPNARGVFAWLLTACGVIAARARRRAQDPRSRRLALDSHV